jgi:O-antigen ligase
MLKYEVHTSLSVNYLIMLYAAVLPLGFALSNIVMAVMCVFLLFLCFVKRIKLSKDRLIWIIIFSSYFILCLLSLLYTNDLDQGFVSLLRKSPIIIFSIFILLLKDYLKPSYIKRALYAYTASIVLVCIVSLILALSNCLENASGFTIACISGEHLASSFISYHKLYLALYITIGIYFANFVLFKRGNTKKRYLLRLFTNLVLILALILLGSRTMLTITLIFLVIVPQIIWFRKKLYAYSILSLIALIMVVGLNLKYNPVLVERVKESINYNNEYGIKRQWGGAAVRKLIWEYTYYVVKENPVFGVGLGDVQTELNRSYENCTESSALKQSTYNAHNDLLQMLVATGIFGLSIFLLCYSYIFMTSFKKLNYVYCGFLALFFLSGLTESYLERDMGIRIFAFFSPLLFVYKSLDENTPNT